MNENREKPWPLREMIAKALIGVAITLAGASFGFVMKVENTNNLQDWRISVNEKALAHLGDADDAFRTEMRNRIEQILTALGDVNRALDNKVSRKP